MNDIITIVDRIRSWVVFPIFSGLVVIMIIYAGILFVTSAGDPSKVTRARQAILWAGVGVLVGLLAYGAVGFIKLIIG